MSDFIRDCFCQGFRPRFLEGAGSRMRPRPLSHLMRERDVARFLVAPAGYGKTSVMAQYAQTMFGFEHVLWVPCDDPRFLRDLDKGHLDQAALMADAGLVLAVFDDVPLLSGLRAESLSNSIDGLLERGCEVLVSCTPSHDAYERLQIDRVLLRASDLVMTDDDLRYLNVLASAEKAPFRTPAEVFAGKEADWILVNGLAGENLPDASLACVLVLLAMGSGPIAAVRELVPNVGDEALGDLERSYPILGLRLREKRFDALATDLDLLVSAFSAKSIRLAEAAGHDGLSDFGCAIGDVLMRLDSYDRACAVVQAMVEKTPRRSWIASHQGTLLANHRLFSMASLCQESGVSSGENGRFVLDNGAGMAIGRGLDAGSKALSSKIVLQQAWCFALLGDADCAARWAYGVAAALPRIAALPSSEMPVDGALHGSVDVRASLALLLKRFCANGSRTAEMLIRECRKLETAHCSYMPWEACLAVELASDRGADAAMDTWWQLSSRGADRDALALSACWLTLTLGGGEAGLAALERAGLQEALELVTGCMGPLGLQGLSASLVGIGPLLCCMGSDGVLLRESAVAGNADLLPAWNDLRLQSLKWQSVKGQVKEKGEYRIGGIGSGRIGGIGVGDIDVGGVGGVGGVGSDRGLRWERGIRGERGECDARGDKPRLRIELLGGVRAFVNDESCSGYLRLTKVRALLALLALDPRREWTRERLVDALWPGLPYDAGRKRLYTVWSRLSATLSLPDGSCPFLTKLQDGYALNCDLVSIDAKEAGELFDVFHYETVHAEEWLAKLRNLNRSYAGDLVPGEIEVEEIVRARDSFSRRRVDGLVAGSTRLLSAGHGTEALKFAQAAHFLDARREDVYSALLAAQIQCGMRPEGIATFVSYRRFMADELGIDPSAEMARLYRSLLQSEEEF